MFLTLGVIRLLQDPAASVWDLAGGFVVQMALGAGIGYVAGRFSLFLINPTPFCILDEVDAPLDDANVGKFTNMIRQFSENSQFIIVTHNKMTMSTVDVIYGVTMQEPGVSKLVSVDFRSIAQN